MTDAPTLLALATFSPEKMAQLVQRFDVHHLHLGPEFGANVAPEIAQRIAPEVLARARCLATDPGRGARADLIALLPKLEIVSSVGVGLDTLDLKAASVRGIAVTNTPDVLTADVADLALCLMIAASRRMVEADRFVREGRWLTSDAPLRRKMSGKILGILGLGRIGKAIAKRAAAFDMPILYTGRHVQPDVPYRYVQSLVDLARDSDFLAVACKGGPETAGLVGADTLAALGPEGILVNVARGSVIDQPAMIDALANGRLGYAALDVFASEPDVSEALLALPNVLVQPHHGSGTVETRNAMAQLAIDNLIAHIDGKPLPSPVLDFAPRP